MSFREDIVKIAKKLYNYSMADRYQKASDEDQEHTPVTYSPTVAPKDIKSFKHDWDRIMTPVGQPGEQYKPRPKFFTTDPSTWKVTPKQFNYKQFSTKNDFKSMSPFIASEEAFDGKTWHTKSLTTGQGGRHAYGYHQIYEDHFVPGAQWYDPKYDKYFANAANTYNSNPTKFGGKDGDIIDSTTGDGRKHLLSLSYPEFNSIDSDSLSYNIARDIYNTTGIGAWNLKDNIIESYKQGTPRHLRNK